MFMAMTDAQLRLATVRIDAMNTHIQPANTRTVPACFFCALAGGKVGVEPAPGSGPAWCDASHICTVLSRLPLATSLPLGAYATEYTASLWLFSGAVISHPRPAHCHAQLDALRHNRGNACRRKYRFIQQ
jgi:hypothetical protein